MCSEMHTGISENRAEIIIDKKLASAQRLKVGALQKRVNESDKVIGEYMVNNSNNLQELHSMIETNKKLTT